MTGFTRWKRWRRAGLVSKSGWRDGELFLNTTLGFMRIPRLSRSGVNFLICVAVLIGVLIAYRLWFDRHQRLIAAEFESRLQQQVDPEELRQWAVGLLKEPSEEFVLVLVTNAPSPVMQLYPYKLYWRVSGSEYPERRHVVLRFAIRTLPAVLIGPTNFVSGYAEDKLWRPGIYLRPYRPQ